MSAVDVLLRVAPQFAGEATATLEAYLGDAALQLAPTVWGVLFEQATAQLAAHLMTLRDRAQATAGDGSGMVPAGGVTSVRTGGLGLTFGAVGAATAGAGEAALRTTPYGLEFLRLRSLVLTTPIVA